MTWPGEGKGDISEERTLNEKRRVGGSASDRRKKQLQSLRQEAYSTPGAEESWARPVWW